MDLFADLAQDDLVAVDYLRLLGLQEQEGLDDVSGEGHEDFVGLEGNRKGLQVFDGLDEVVRYLYEEKIQQIDYRLEIAVEYACLDPDHAKAQDQHIFVVSYACLVSVRKGIVVGYQGSYYLLAYLVDSQLLVQFVDGREFFICFLSLLAVSEQANVGLDEHFHAVHQNAESLFIPLHESLMRAKQQIQVFVIDLNAILMILR